MCDISSEREFFSLHTGVMREYIHSLTRDDDDNTEGDAGQMKPQHGRGDNDNAENGAWG